MRLAAAAMLLEPVSALAQSMPATQPAGTSPQSAVTPATQADPIALQQQRQLQVFAPILLNPSNDIDSVTRRNAASELLEMQIPEALETLRQALRSRLPAVVSAVIAAIHSRSAAPDALLDAACGAVATAPAEVQPALASVLARFGDAGALCVADLIARPDAPALTRLNAVAALGSFRSRHAAAALMRVLDTAPPGPSPVLDAGRMELVRAATTSLQHMTGLTYGGDLARWREWWNRAAQAPEDQWHRLISESLANRVAALETQLQEQRQSSKRTSDELYTAYRDLYPALPVDEQLRRLPRLLKDPLAPVREFGLSRVAVLVRDSVRIPGEITDLVLGGLNDPAPELRQAAAKLLDELNDDRTALALAARLAVEDSPTVIAVLLDGVARRPSESAIDPMLRLLASEVSGTNAAEALWTLLLANPASPDTLAKVREAAREAVRTSPSHQTLRLAALVGDERDAVELTSMLDGEDRTLRAAVAEGFWKRGLRQPLLDRANDDAIYPFAIRAVADGPADLPAFNLLVGMRPSERDRRLWGEMITRLAARLKPLDLPAADEIVRNIGYADQALRRDILLAATALPRDVLTAADRVRIVERLAPLLIDLGDAARAWEVLETINGAAAAAPALRSVQFQAAALTGHYDRAAQIQGDSAAWLDLLAREMQRQNPACPRLYDEITRRFGDEMGAEGLQRLRDIGAALGGADRRG